MVTSTLVMEKLFDQKILVFVKLVLAWIIHQKKITQKLDLLLDWYIILKYWIKGLIDNEL